MPPPPTLTPPPTLESNPPKEVPWWGALILAILVSLVSVVATIYAIQPRVASAVAAPPGIGQLFTDSIRFLPYVLILFGVFADIFTLQGAYSIPSLVGLASIPLNFALQYFWGGIASILAGAYTLAMSTPGGAPPVLPSGLANLAAVAAGPANAGWDGCEIPGFSGLSSSYAPQSLVVTATIFWYYLLDLLMNRDVLDSSVTWLGFIVFFGAQAMLLKTCPNMVGSFLIKTFIALTEGFIIGGIGYGIVQATIPSRLPSSAIPVGPNLSSLTKNADGTYKDGSGKKYVVGPDGRPIPASFIEAAARATATTTTTTGS